MALIDLLPGYYAASSEVVELQAAFDAHAEALMAARNDLMAQFNVMSATWGLASIWEKALGIETDVSKSDEYRRTRIIAKLRGSGTTTASMIRNVAESFSNGEVEIIEHAGEYRFVVKFTGTLGIPPNMDDLTAALGEIKPAHLAYEFAYTYRRYEELTPFTHGELSAYTHEDLREGELAS